MSEKMKSSLETKKSGEMASHNSIKSNRLAPLLKGAWAVFVTLQVVAAGWHFLLFFYVFLSFVGSLLGTRFVVKEWRVLLGESDAPAAWLLLGFLTARLLCQVSLDLMERFRKARCATCGVELAPSAPEVESGKAPVCPKCGAKL